MEIDHLIASHFCRFIYNNVLAEMACKKPR